MDDHTPGGAKKNKEIITPNREIIPIAATTVDATNTTSVPLIKRRWFQVTLGLAAVALVVGIIANALQIPNSAMDLWNRWKNPSKPRANESPAFSIISRHQYIELRNPRNLLLWNVNNQSILSPIHVEMSVDFVNLKGTPLAISSIQFEGRMQNGGWKLLPMVDIRSGRLLWLTNTNFNRKDTVLQVGIERYFQALIEGQTITPGGPVSGFVFLEAPTNGFDGSIRMKLRDKADNEYVELVKPFGETNLLATPVSLETRSLSRVVEDISELPIKPYSNPW